MAAKRSAFGMAHPTVVPTNFDPADEFDADADRSDDRDADEA